MSRRKKYRMAHPQSNRSSGRANAKPAAKTPQDAPLSARIASGVVAWLRGPIGRQILALIVTGIGLVTLVTIAGYNSGAWINAWARFLVLVFGWGAYPVAALIVTVGLLWLRHLIHQPTAWRWRPFLGFELTLIGLLTLTWVLTAHNWQWIESGRGGGVIGWALYQFLTHAIGPLLTSITMVVLVILGLSLAFDVTGKDVLAFGHKAGEVWAAMREARQAAASEAQLFNTPRADKTMAEGVAFSPMSKREATTQPPTKPERESVAATMPQARTAIGTDPRPTTERKPAFVRPASNVKNVPITLLRQSKTVGLDAEEIRRKSQVIEETLAQFGVPGRVVEVRPGPTVTQFGVSPGYVSRGAQDESQRKVRVSQIESLADDLALALAAKSLRVEAPVPGRAVVGIEVPNAEISTVTLRSVLESEAFNKCDKPLCFAIGLDVAGSAQVADLSRMPHLLVAGTTGSGKSVFMRALAVSLVMHNPPDMLKLITIDPKMVELSHLDGLPHLMAPAVSDLDRIIRVLRWVAHEMDERYKLFAECTARNLDDYNAKLARSRKSAARDDESSQPALMPRIVVLIDELADLMMSAPEETERTLTRIAQMARATGIHMVVATQRPSTDVVTGLIKANFPARISFATTSGTDSRVIIDTPGAETLLGRGDMLFLPPELAAPLRIQGCMISEEELQDIIAFWQKEAGATPARSPWDVTAEEKGPDRLRIEGQDEDANLLERAIAYARQHGDISSSGLQRDFRISYNRAARLMEEMEQMGIVGPQVSAGKKRRVILGGDDR